MRTRNSDHYGATWIAWDPNWEILTDYLLITYVGYSRYQIMNDMDLDPSARQLHVLTDYLLITPVTK